MFNALVPLLSRILNKFGKQRVMALLCTGLLVSTNLLMVHQQYQANRKAQYPYMYVPTKPVAWASYQEIFEWVRENTQSSEIIAYGLDSMLYLYTGRQSFRPFVMQPETLFYGRESAISEISELRNFLEVYRPGYLISSPMPGFSEEKPFTELLTEVHNRYPGCLETVYQGLDSRFVIYKIHYALFPSV
jgi:hypothetical protein